MNYFIILTLLVVNLNKTITNINPTQNSKDGRLIFTFDATNGGHQGSVLSFLSLKSGFLVSGATDYTIKIWNVYKRELKFTFDKTNDGADGSVTNLVELEDGCVASGLYFIAET